MTSETIQASARAGSAPVRAANHILGVLCLMYLMLYVDRVNIATVAPQITSDLGLSHAQFGFAVSAFAYPYALFQLVGGWVGDRLGPRLALLLCGIVVCVATVLTGLAGGIASLVAARLALGFGEGSAFPTATRAMAIWIPADRWGFAQGITHAAARLGNAITPLLIAGLLGYVSWRMSFVVMGLFSIIWIVLWQWVSQNGAKQLDAASRGESGSAAVTASANSDRPYSSVPWSKLARRMLPVTAVDFCYGWTLWVSLTWLPSFFLQNFHLDLQRSALFTSAVLLSGVVGNAAGGSLSDLIYRRTGNLRLARRNLIIFGLLGALVFLLPVVVSRDLAVVTLSLAATCFCSELIVGPIWAVPMDIAPDYAGSASGIMNFGFGLAGIVSPVVFGSLLDLTGNWTTPFYCSIFLLMLGALLSFQMRPEKPFLVTK
ncbi:MAG TPA: MFS transporter [Rhizomicrobium sp.]